MHRTLPLFFAVVALAVCAGKSYTITLFSPATVGNNELKAGEYRVQIVDQNALVIDGKGDTRTAVKVETVKEKFSNTSVRIDTTDGKARVQEIRLGGTNTKLVIAAPSTNAAN
jgi:hypothetical protein